LEEPLNEQYTGNHNPIFESVLKIYPATGWTRRPHLQQLSTHPLHVNILHHNPPTPLIPARPVATNSHFLQHRVNTTE
jgi:hypothetical protein